MVFRMIAWLGTKPRPRRAESSSSGSRACHGLRGLGLMFAAIVVCGCTTGPRDWLRNGLKVGPNFCRPAAAVADQWLDEGNPNIQPDATDDSYWWATFDDPVLNDLVSTAAAQNLSLRIAGMRVLESRAQRGVAVGGLFPQQQQAVGQMTRTEFSQTSFPFGQIPLNKTAFDTWSLGFDAAWELDFWGRYRRAIEAADEDLNARIENYDDALVVLQGEVAAAYIQLRTAEEQLALIRQNVALQKKTLRLTQDRFEGEVVSELDVQQARSIVAVTSSTIPVFVRNHRQARNRLCILMGMPPQDLEARLSPSRGIPAAPPEVAVGIPADLLRRRPDIRRAEREAAAQCARIGIAESDFYPHISIAGTIGIEAENLSRLFDADSFAGVVGPGFRWNILNYGRIRNNVNVQDARFQQAALKYQEAVLRANEEVENAIISYLQEQERVEQLQASSAAEARAVELASLQYEEGLVDFQRLLDSQRGLVIQQDALAQSRGNVALFLVAVYKALGGGWQARYEPNRLLEAESAEEVLPPLADPAADTTEPRAPELVQVR